MCDERVDQILREGAGDQWDSEVVKAYFDAKDDIATIAKRERIETMEHWV